MPPDEAGTLADVIVVLGCRVLADGSPSAALARRIRLAGRAFERGAARQVIASGGRLWRGDGVHSEADCIARGLLACGVPDAAIARERCSLTTVENAYYCAQWLRTRGLQRALLCSCPWHFARAARHFAHHGVEPVAPPNGWYEHVAQPWWRPWRERVNGLFDHATLTLLESARPR